MTSLFIKKQIALYKSLEPCFCTAIQETVHFTSDGLNHLLYYRRRPRNHDERHYRAGLIPHIIPVIINAKTAVKEIKMTNPKVTTIWILKHPVNVNGHNKIVKVILIKEGAGKIKFLSTMCNKTNKKPSNN